MGASLPNAKLAYKTHGKLNAAKDNAILFPHMYSGTPHAMESFIGEGQPARPGQVLHHPARPVRQRLLVLAEQYSSSMAEGAFPQVTIGDDVRAQHLLVTETFGIEALQLVLG